ncbi:MAG: FxsA family protein [Firmicutes bacterium]|nr:FxsA family protein [Bacillota bacterium]
MLKFILVATLVPLAELWILIEIGKVIGSVPTILLVLGTALLGALLLRSQGFYILREIRRELAQGLLPGEKLFDGLCVLIGGLLLVVPGLITDLGGFLLLIPYTRDLFKTLLRRYLRRAVDRGDFLIHRRW